MKQTNKILKGLILSTLVLFLGFSSSADIILILGSGVDQGMGSKWVSETCVGSTATVTCRNPGTSTCPTNAQIRSNCEGAIVHQWIPNAGTNGLDNTVASIVSQFGLGTTSGTIVSVYQNTQTLEIVSVTFVWNVNPLDSEEVVITISED